MPASDDVTSDFPTPPFPDTTPITCFIFEFLLGASRNAVFLTPFLAAAADRRSQHMVLSDRRSAGDSSAHVLQAPLLLTLLNSLPEHLNAPAEPFRFLRKIGLHPCAAPEIHVA